jgi:cyclopropane fatty-acyl-phospholipid synthase-like methyltransferase
MDKSNGYENIASIFIKGRGQAINGIGTSSVRKWAKTLTPDSTVLEIGCGTGVPVSKILLTEGMKIYGIDASPTMVKTFQQNFPNAPVECESVENSLFFNRQFDAIIAWGLLFLLSEETQPIVIKKCADALKTGGRFLFTSLSKRLEWKDAMTEQHSISLGAEIYRVLLISSGFSLIEEFQDEGENYYYHALKV